MIETLCRLTGGHRWIPLRTDRRGTIDRCRRCPARRIRYTPVAKPDLDEYSGFQR